MTIGPANLSINFNEVSLALLPKRWGNDEEPGRGVH